jgi:hypothetical protein
MAAHSKSVSSYRMIRGPGCALKSRSNRCLQPAKMGQCTSEFGGKQTLICERDAVGQALAASCPFLQRAKLALSSSNRPRGFYTD